MPPQIFRRSRKHTDTRLDNKILKAFVVQGRRIIKLLLQVMVNLLGKILRLPDRYELVQCMIFNHFP